MDVHIRYRTPAGQLVETTMDAALTPAARDLARAEANAWIKRLRLVPYGESDMRGQFTFRDDSLWWFTELYLHKTRHLDRAVAVVLALDAIALVDRPSRVGLDAIDPVARAAAAAWGRARGIAVDGADAPRAENGLAWPSYLIGLTASLSRLRPHARQHPARPPAVAAFVHSAFLADRPDGAASDASVPGERYVGPVLEAIAAHVPRGDLLCVGVGPRRNFRARRWWDPIVTAGRTPAIVPIERLAPARALVASRALWRRRHDLALAIVTGEGIRAAGVYRGVDLWDVLRPELEAVAQLQWPWSARAMDEAAAALDDLQPRVVVTYAEAGGWGRALVLEARRRGLPSVGLQHGFIYRHWLNYQHDADEMVARGADAGFPRPTRTLVFDTFTARQLEQAGSFPSPAVAVTGSPQLDRLAARLSVVTPDERRAARAALGATGDQPLALLVAKGTEIAPDLPALRAALAARPGIRLVVKPHPAETPAAYAELATLTHVTLASGDADLAHLLAAADVVVTRNSTVAVDALVLGIPALVIGLPNNLSPFVEAGAMAGADGEGIGGALEALLYDRGARQRIAQAAATFASEAGMRADGRAADRAARAILDLIPE